MRTKVQERNKVVTLRKQGKTYLEIQKRVGVSKGTISKWCQTIPLSKKEQQYVTERGKILQDKGRLKVAEQNRTQHETKRERVRVAAAVDYERFKPNHFLLLV